MNLYPKNDFGFEATLWKIDPTTGVKSLYTGTAPTVFLAVSSSPTAGIADATLTGTAVLKSNSKWLIFIDGQKLQDVTLLDGLFLASGLAYVVLEVTNDIRAALEVNYVKDRLIVAA